MRSHLACAVVALAPLVGCSAPASQPAAVHVTHLSALPATNPATQPATRPARRPVVDAAIKRGVDFLVTSQNKDGSWGTGKETRGFEVMASVPGSLKSFQVATTALCVMALREAGETEAHKKGLEFLVTNYDVRRDDGQLMYNTWAHSYALQCLSIEIRHSDDPRLRVAAEAHLKKLGGYETYMGGWNYYDFHDQTQTPSMGPTSFGSSATLVALYEAKASKLPVSQKMIDMALKRLAEMRLPNNSYLYGADYKYMPRLPANMPRGSVGRTQAGNFALWQWAAGGMDEKKVREGLEFFFAEHKFIEMGRKRQFPHEAWYQTAPYYYYFGHYYTARLIEKLGPEATAQYGPKLADVGILQQQDEDGSWWDFAMWDFHKPYGTAFAVMTLLRCQ
ncbi:MAG TPA: hypothetical protein VF796_14815 [Humisphaera sp.]